VRLLHDVWQINKLDAKMDQALQLLTTLTKSQSELGTNHKEQQHQCNWRWN